MKKSCMKCYYEHVGGWTYPCVRCYAYSHFVPVGYLRVFEEAPE